MSNVEIKWQNEGERLQVKISGTLDFLNSRDIKGKIMEKLETDTALLRVDLAEIEHIDSTGIALLATLRRTMSNRSGNLEVCNAPFNVTQIFRLIGLETFFETRHC